MNFPTNEVRKLFQDSQGYRWISTYNGLLRYDGYSIVVYKPDGVNHGRSIDSFVNMVAEDKENNLWIGTHNGLYVLPKETDGIEKISFMQVTEIYGWEATRDCFAEKPAAVLSIVKKTWI